MTSAVRQLDRSVYERSLAQQCWLRVSDKHWNVTYTVSRPNFLLQSLSVFQIFVHFTGLLYYFLTQLHDAKINSLL